MWLWFILFLVLTIVCGLTFVCLGLICFYFDGVRGPVCVCVSLISTCLSLKGPMKSNSKSLTHFSCVNFLLCPNDLNKIPWLAQMYSVKTYFKNFTRILQFSFLGIWPIKYNTLLPQLRPVVKSRDVNQLQEADSSLNKV